MRSIGADSVPQVLVFNKIDAVPELAARGETIERDEYGNISRVFLSARTGQGLDALRATPSRWGQSPVFFYGFNDLHPLQRDAIRRVGSGQPPLPVLPETVQLFEVHRH